MCEKNRFEGVPSGLLKMFWRVFDVHHALVDVHGAPRLLRVRLGHESGVDLVTQRRLARRPLEEKRLVGQIQRIAVDQVDLHLRRPILVDERIDLDVLVLAELVDVIEQRIELVDRRDAVRLPARLGATRAPDRRPQRIVRVLVLLDEIELELRSHDRLPAALRIQLEHVAQHVARSHGDPAAVRIEAVVDDLGRRLGSPGHAAHRLRIGLEDDVDLGGTHRIPGVRRIVTRSRSAETRSRAAACPHPRQTSPRA